MDVGLRYASGRTSLAATWYDVAFRNRIVFVDGRDIAGPDFLISTAGAYLNAGGIESEGLEVSGRIRAGNSLVAYLAYTRNASRYAGSAPA